MIINVHKRNERDAQSYPPIITSFKNLKQFGGFLKNTIYFNEYIMYQYTNCFSRINLYY